MTSSASLVPDVTKASRSSGFQRSLVATRTERMRPRIRLDVTSDDVAAVAASAAWWQPNTDEKVPGGRKYELIGRDIEGRELYTAGKETIHNGEAVWYVITIHEAE